MSLGERVLVVTEQGKELNCRVLGQTNGVLLLCRDDQNKQIADDEEVFALSPEVEVKAE